MAGHTHFDEALEEYLEAVYRLEREGPGVTTSGLAAQLGVAPASVSGMLKKLAEGGFIEYRARSEAKLTERGLAVAVRVMRRHRLAECMLTDLLGMPWDQIHDEACRFEHAISAAVEERLVAVLGNPKFCPHGHPIPSADLSEPERSGVKLEQLPVGAMARIVDVCEDVPEMLRYLDTIGMRPGETVDVRERGPLGGPLTVATARGPHAISLELARLITVLPEASANLQTA